MSCDARLWIEPTGSRPISAFVILVFRGLWNGAALALCRHDELYEMKRFRRAGIPMRMDCAGRDEQTISGVQRDWRLAVLLPNTRPGQNVKGDCCWMQMTRIQRAGRVSRVPNNDLLAWCIGQFAPQQKRMGYWGCCCASAHYAAGPLNKQLAVK